VHPEASDEELTCDIGEVPVFRYVSVKVFGLSEGERVGVIGSAGSERIAEV